jgi:hypothetical protein
MGSAISKGERAIRHNIRDIFSLRTRSRRRLIMGPLTNLDHLPENLHSVEFYSWGRDAFFDQAPLES